MKRCPQCYRVFAAAERFCDEDGEVLVADLLVVDSEPEPQTAGLGPQGDALKKERWFAGVVGVIIGIIVCAGLFAVYEFSQIVIEPKSEREAPRQNTERGGASRAAVTKLPEELPDSEASPLPTEEVLEDASPTPAATESVIVKHFNDGPVTTTKTTTTTSDTIIFLVDGTAVQVDAAWEDSQGVWYRRGGVVSFIDGKLVKSVGARPTDHAASAEAQNR